MSREESEAAFKRLLLGADTPADGDDVVTLVGVEGGLKEAY
jgi:hypothetical protein